MDFEGRYINLILPLKAGVRKLEFFKDGTVDAAGGNVETERTRLSLEALPSLGDINRDPQFEGSNITREAFEAQWREHAADKR